MARGRASAEDDKPSSLKSAAADPTEEGGRWQPNPANLRGQALAPDLEAIGSFIRDMIKRGAIVELIARRLEHVEVADDGREVDGADLEAVAEPRFDRPARETAREREPAAHLEEEAGAAARVVGRARSQPRDQPEGAEPPHAGVLQADVARRGSVREPSATEARAERHARMKETEHRQRAGATRSKPVPLWRAERNRAVDLERQEPWLVGGGARRRREPEQSQYDEREKTKVRHAELSGGDSSEPHRASVSLSDELAPSLSDRRRDLPRKPADP